MEKVKRGRPKNSWSKAVSGDSKSSALNEEEDWDKIKKVGATLKVEVQKTHEVEP